MRWILIALLASTLGGVSVAFASGLNVDSARVTVFKNTLASPTLTTALTTSSITAGGSAGATATLAGYAGTPSGTVTFTVYTDSTCTTPHAIPLNQVAVSVPTTSSNLVTFAAAGTYYWNAAYSGDGYNQPSFDCLATPLTVTAP